MQWEIGLLLSLSLASLLWGSQDLVSGEEKPAANAELVTASQSSGTRRFRVPFFSLRVYSAHFC